MNIKVTGRNDGPAFREPFDVTIEGERCGYSWHHFKTAKERDAFAEGAVLGGSIENDQHDEAHRDSARMDDLVRLLNEGEDVLDALADMARERETTRRPTTQRPTVRT